MGIWRKPEFRPPYQPQNRKLLPQTTTSTPVEVNAVPINIVLSLVAPLIEHQNNLFPVNAGISVVAPNLSLNVNTSPLNLGISVASSTSSEGPNSPDSGVNTNFASAPSWSNPGNVITSNDSYATVSINGVAGLISDALDVTDFDFTIPNGSTISGITVEIERKTSGTSGTPRDHTIQLIKGGTASGDNKATGTNWPLSDQYDSYGSSSDLWGLTFTPSDINAIDFGIRIRAQITTGNSAVMSVDHVRITVNYVTAPVTIEHQINTSPSNLIISCVSPLLQHEINTTPINFVITVIAPNVGQTIIVNTTPIDIKLSIIAPLLQLQLSTSPIDLKISAVAPTLVHEVNTSPVNIEIIIVAPNVGQTITVNTTPINIKISIISPSVEKNYLISPIDLELSIATPLIQHQINSSSVNIVASVVSPLLQIQVNVTPLNLLISVINVGLVHEVNTSPLNLIITVVTATTSHSSIPGEIEVVVTPFPITGKNNLFAAFHERVKFVSKDNPISEFLLEDTNYPYISLGQVFNVLSWKNSCLERFEESNFRLNIYCESYWELEEKTELIENTLIYSTLLLNPPKKVISLEQIEKIQSELLPQLYRSQLIYEVIVQKEIDQTYILSPTSGETINKCIYERFKNLPLAGMVNDLVSPGYALENNNYPFIVVPTIRENLSWNNTKGRIDNKKYPITIYSEDLNELIDVMDEVEKSFDYAKFIINGRNHLINEWVGTDVVEVIPQLWCGKVNYEILVESPIDVFG